MKEQVMAKWNSLKEWSKDNQPSGFFTIFLISFLIWALAPDSVVSSLAVVMNNFVGGFPSALDLLRLITYQFAHANFSHLSGNFFFAAPFAMYAERRLGRTQFIHLWLISGIFSAVMFMIMAFATPMILMQLIFGMPVGLIGASGSISGVFTYAALSYNDKWWKKLLGWSGLALFIVPQFIMMGISTYEPMGVAFAGHVGGFVGAILWIATRKPKA